ncbi:MAG: SDR family NAD(P)-dependent oxidoreductase [Chitinivibrionales bacterium]|nr:SDR family NAD(P)-dependent oxidoreductase [Chitinivibrionales bacterium]
MKDKTILITGASSGIGKSCGQRFGREGCRLILASRNKQTLSQLANVWKETYACQCYVAGCDVRDRKQVESLFENLPEEWQTIDVVINNAGLAAGLEKVHEADIDDWEVMIDTNIKGLLYVTKKAVSSMILRSRPGHIINIGSIAGVAAYPNGAVYCATKAAVHMISDGLRLDVVDKPIRVTNIQPGMVETNFSTVRFHGDTQRAAHTYKGITPLSGDDIADIVFYAASTPDHVQICEITVTPTHQSSATVVYRTNG